MCVLNRGHEGEEKKTKSQQFLWQIDDLRSVQEEPSPLSLVIRCWNLPLKCLVALNLNDFENAQIISYSSPTLQARTDMNKEKLITTFFCSIFYSVNNYYTVNDDDNDTLQKFVVGHFEMQTFAIIHKWANEGEGGSKQQFVFTVHDFSSEREREGTEKCFNGGSRNEIWTNLSLSSLLSFDPKKKRKEKHLHIPSNWMGVEARERLLLKVNS